MGCPKLTYHLTAEPRLRCVYNAADGEECCVIPLNPKITANPAPLYGADASGVLLQATDPGGTRRGYTGHEHLLEFGLINMNARLYDPVVGRFLSPDPYVQDPYFSQSFNRMAYALNNPLLYTDPNGELAFTIITAILNAIFRIVTLGQYEYASIHNAFAIDMGFAFSDFGLVSFAGYLAAGLLHIAGGVQTVTNYGGATAVETNFYWDNGRAVTLGYFIIGEPGLQASPHNSIFQHEFGHYLQYREMGSVHYIRKVVIPSLKTDPVLHDFHIVEQDASRRAFLYFNEHEPGFYKSPEDQIEFGNTRGWNFRENPLDVNGTATRGVYYDYLNEEHLALINGLRIR